MQLLAAGVNNLAGEAATAAAEAGAAEADAGSTTEAHPRTTAAAAIRAVTAVAREILRLIHDPFEHPDPAGGGSTGTGTGRSPRLGLNLWPARRCVMYLEILTPHGRAGRPASGHASSAAPGSAVT